MSTVATGANFTDNSTNLVPTLANATTNPALAAYSYGQGTPNSASAASFVNSTTPNSTAALTGQNLIGLGVMGANLGGDSNSSGTFNSQAEYITNRTGTNNLTIALLNLAASGNGFQSLSFTVKDNGSTLLSDTFTSLASAQTFFTDDPLTFYNLASGVDLSLNFSLTASSESAGISYAIGDTAGTAPVPLPPTLPMLLGGLVSLMFVRRHRLPNLLPRGRVRPAHLRRAGLVGGQACWTLSRHYSNGAACQILLIPNSFIGGQQEREAFALGGFQQFAV